MMFSIDPNMPFKKTGSLSIEVMLAIKVIVDQYREHYKLKWDTPLTHKQIASVLEGIRDVIYQSEGTIKPKI